MAPELSEHGQQLVSSLASRTGFSPEAVGQLLMALQRGNGTMAQFSHPEFGGSGQWARGGMLMIGDMFNDALKARVNALATELASALVAGSPAPMQASPTPSQSQSSGGMAFASVPPSVFAAHPQSPWYPADLGTPNSSGAQNATRYAYFAGKRRLAVEAGGKVALYDTLEHQINGFGQQQGGAGTLTFTSQNGTVDLSTLPVVSDGNGSAVGIPAQQPTPGSSNSTQASIFETISQLAALKDQGILTEQEFAAKKAELLARI
jgi:hypothetical protein